MKKILIFCILSIISDAVFAQKNEEKNAILKMAGTYKVSFDFIETFTLDTNYVKQPDYHASAKEMVVVTENSENKISLNHFLLVNDTIVIKHWRQDWIYENTEFLEYGGNNTWMKYSLPKQAVKGTWTQKVFQIDESPRYEAYGKWAKEDEEWVWTSFTCSSPLPRRELLKRSDYDILKRRSRIVIGKDYWYLEQDNQKMKSDTLLVHEKGMELFSRASFDSSRIINWWQLNQKYWRVVTVEWNNIIRENKKFHLTGTLITSDYQSEIFKVIGGLKKSGKDDTYIHAEIRSFILKMCLVSL